MFFAYKKMLGRTETRTRDRMYFQTIRTVRDISRDDRSIIATCSLRTPTDRLKLTRSIEGVRLGFARSRRKEGRTERRKGGRKEGRKEGMKEGRKEGRKE